MDMPVCPACKMRVIPKADGTCPSCGRKLGKDAPANRVSETRQEVRSAPSPARSKVEKVSSRAATTGEKSPGDLYQAFLQEAEDITRKGWINVLLPFIAVTVLLVLVQPLVTDTLVPALARDKIENKYSAAPELMLQYEPVQAELYAETILLQGRWEWALNILTALMPFAGLIVFQRQMTAEARAVNRSMHGFKRFFELGYGLIKKGRSWGRYWPGEFPAGEKRKEFLDIVGKRE